MYSSTLPLPSALGGGGWSTPRPGRFTPGERPGTHCIGGWVGPRAGVDGCGKSRPPLPPGFCSESLYRLSYPGQFTSHVLGSNILDTQAPHIIPSQRPHFTPVKDFNICCEQKHGLEHSRNWRKDNTWTEQNRAVHNWSVHFITNQACILFQYTYRAFFYYSVK